MEIIGYLSASLIGMSLGLIGGGGSILTVPVMVYLFSVQPSLATSYSLFVVGSASLVGACNHYRKGLVNVKIALLFGVSSVATVFLTREFIMPLIPETICLYGNCTIRESLLVMILFALVMLIASVSMIRSKDQQNEDGQQDKKISYYKLAGLVLNAVQTSLINYHFEDKFYHWPLPQTEIDKSGGIQVQNPDYK